MAGAKPELVTRVSDFSICCADSLTGEGITVADGEPCSTAFAMRVTASKKVPKADEPQATVPTKALSLIHI